MTQGVTWSGVVLAFLPLFVAVDPFGLLPVFVGLTHRLSAKERAAVIRQSLATAFGVAIVFLLVGRSLFRVLGITVGDFMIAGGLLLFVLAVTDLVNPKGLEEVAGDFGIVPLGVPLIVGPAVLASLILLTNTVGMANTLIGLVLNIAFVGGMFLAAERLMRWLGENGTKVISKITSLFLAAIAVMLVRRGLELFGWLKAGS